MNYALIEELISKGKNIRILYVEDDEIARDAMCGVLENLFDCVTLASNGKEGLEKFKSGDFDIVFTDINMPVMDGITMIQEIKLLSDATLFLVLSASREADEFENIANLKVDGHLFKPINMNAMVEKLLEIIDKIKK
ncbi:MAG: hypothetical protein QG559_1517 [Campylobacterota bacterium]|nr:hypothetical protein [Campylobacterota bacterium]